MPEWRKIFEAEDSDLPDLGAMEVCSSTEMGAPGASHLGTGGHGPKTDRSRPRSVPVNALVAGHPATDHGSSAALAAIPSAKPTSRY
jgi:hypothetical protein